MRHVLLLTAKSLLFPATRSGGLATFVAIRRASSQVRSLTPDRQPDASVEISLTKINDLLLGEYRAAARPHQDAIIRERREWGVRGVIGV